MGHSRYTLNRSHPQVSCDQNFVEWFPFPLSQQDLFLCSSPPCLRFAVMQDQFTITAKTLQKGKKAINQTQFLLSLDETKK